MTEIVPYIDADWEGIEKAHDAARMQELRLAGLADAFLPLSVAAEREGLFEYTVLVAREDGAALDLQHLRRTSLPGCMSTRIIRDRELAEAWLVPRWTEWPPESRPWKFFREMNRQDSFTKAWDSAGSGCSMGLCRATNNLGCPFGR